MTNYAGFAVTLVHNLKLGCQTNPGARINLANTLIWKQLWKKDEKDGILEDILGKQTTRILLYLYTFTSYNLSSKIYADRFLSFTTEAFLIIVNDHGRPDGMNMIFSILY